MKQEALNYVQKQLTNAPFRLKNYIQDESGFTFRSRNISIKIKKYIESFTSGTGNDRWVIIPGLRGVGKTTILAQFFSRLYRSIPDNKYLLFFSLDEVINTLGLSLTDILEAYEYLLGTSYEKLNAKTYIFIDEVQSDKDWGVTLKTLYDKTKNVFIIVSGSSAVSLQTNADVSRRAVIEKLYPMNFCEFQMIKNNILPVAGLKQNLYQALYDAETAQEAFDSLIKYKNEYLGYWSKIDKTEIEEFIEIGTFPFAIKKDKSKVLESVNLLLEKVIAQDIRDYAKFDLDTLQSIKRLLFLLADATDAISIHKLTTLLHFNHITLNTILDILEKAELLIKVTPKGSNANKIKKPSKYLFMSPTYRLALLDIAGDKNTFLTREGKIIEDIIGANFYREFVTKGKGTLSYDTALSSADFILEIGNEKRIVVEVGRGDKGSGQVIKTMEKVKSKFGMIICKEISEPSIDNNILKLPLFIFLLT